MNMTDERKKYLDGVWLNTEVGRWAVFLAMGKNDDADKILDEIFDRGYIAPYEYIMNEEKKLCQKVKSELLSPEEGKEYVLELEKSNYDLVDIMVAHEFTLLDLYYE